MMICLLALVFCVFGIFKQTSAHTSRSYAELRDMILSEQVNEIVVDEGSVTLALKTPLETGEREVSFPLYSFELFYQDFNQILQEQKEAAVLRALGWSKKLTIRRLTLEQAALCLMGLLLAVIALFAVNGTGFLGVILVPILYVITHFALCVGASAAISASILQKSPMRLLQVKE